MGKLIGTGSISTPKDLASVLDQLSVPTWPIWHTGEPETSATFQSVIRVVKARVARGERLSGWSYAYPLTAWRAATIATVVGLVVLGVVIAIALTADSTQSDARSRAWSLAGDRSMG